MNTIKTMLVLAAVICSSAIFSQSVASNKVPAEVLKAFKTKFPTAAEVNWTKETNTNYEARFISGNEKQRAEFDPNGVWIETETPITVAQLPQTISNAVMKQNPSCKITDAEEIQNSGQGKIYEIGCVKGAKRKDYRVTADGQVQMELYKKY